MDCLENPGSSAVVRAGREVNPSQVPKLVGPEAPVVLQLEGADHPLWLPCPLRQSWRFPILPALSKVTPQPVAGQWERGPLPPSFCRPPARTPGRGSRLVFRACAGSLPVPSRSPDCSNGWRARPCRAACGPAFATGPPGRRTVHARWQKRRLRTAGSATTNAGCRRTPVRAAEAARGCPGAAYLPARDSWHCDRVCDHARVASADLDAARSRRPNAASPACVRTDQRKKSSRKRTRPVSSR